MTDTATRKYDPATFARLLFGADAAGPAEYDRATVARLLFEEAVELLPNRLSASELSMRIVLNSEDVREVETAGEAICDLQRSGLIRHRRQGLMEPTLVAVCAHALLTARRPYRAARQRRGAEPQLSVGGRNRLEAEHSNGR